MVWTVWRWAVMIARLVLWADRLITRRRKGEGSDEEPNPLI